MAESTLHLHTSELAQAAKELRAGGRVLLSGPVYTARDAAHARIAALLDAGKEPPFPLKGAAVYYAGPTGTPPGLPIGSCGPTTSARMDVYTPRLLELGLAAAIGKGERDEAVRDAIRRCGAVYFCALGGAGALACRCIRACDVVAFADLGCESVKRLEFERFPLFVALDAAGGSIFENRAKWARGASA